MPDKLTFPIRSILDGPVAAIRAGASVSVFGMSFGERAVTTAATERFFVWVTTDYTALRSAARELRRLTGGEIVELVGRGDVLNRAVARDLGLLASRTHALGSVLRARARGVVATADALMQLLPAPDVFLSRIVDLEKGGSVAPAAVAERLAAAGYVRADLADSAGRFSLRGDILDIFAVGEEKPFRIEFWGDLIETIRIVEPETYVSAGELDAITVYPATEGLYTASDGAAAAKRLARDVPHLLEPEAATRAERLVGELTATLESNVAGTEFVLPYVSHALFADYLPPGTLLVYDETKAVLDGMQGARKEHVARYKSLLESGTILVGSLGQLVDFDTVRARYGAFCGLSFARITASNLFFEPKRIFNYSCIPIAHYALDFALLSEDLRHWLDGGYRILLCCRDPDGVALVRQGLEPFGIGATLSREELFCAERGVCAAPIELDRGFSSHDDSLIVVGTEDLFPERRKMLHRAGTRSLFVQPVAGDYVVHYVHGIGRCNGTVRLTNSMGTKDYIEVEYRDGDKLFVPVDQTDLLSKYAGSAPRLNKMGGGEFARVKQRVREGVRKMAIDLVRLYGERMRSSGYAYAVDDTLMREFVDAFPFESTADQINATADITADLRSGKIMDRLLVGDVGYGKTEVALRAAFAVAIEGKQVAFLAPTTILAEQHYRTASERLAPFGIRVAVLDRFTPAPLLRETLGRIRSGTVDVVIGTHRLLSKDVAFADLGLLILDEEQRFGVSDKEKLKAYKNTVNVLTMTATPIPRTLHMSLSGIRSISTLSEPPADRLPVQTYVTEYSDELAADCINRELARGGQAFVVYNRVESIYQYAAQLAKVVPGARMLVCHGQMPEAELETNVKHFYDGEADVLVTTTIIENGVDLPLANTMLVVDADAFGLAQLYQLRGRVGRSNRLAYAYFTYTPGKLLTETAQKRLTTLLEFTAFGSGFRIAMRDLEIRGAGNVLGAEQHGHMDKVGYDLYCRILSEVVGELTGGQEQREKECEVVMDVDAYLPDTYIPDAESRMNLYSRIATVRTRADRERLIAELTDIYGPPPTTVTNLVTIGLFKGLGVRLGLARIRISRVAASLTLRAVEPWIPRLSAKEFNCTLRSDTLPVIEFFPDGRNLYETVFSFLTAALAQKAALAGKKRA